MSYLYSAKLAASRAKDPRACLSKLFSSTKTKIITLANGPPLWSGAGGSKYSKPLNGWLSEVSSVSTIRTRMEKAAHLLAATFLSVKEIMANVGYDNRANFLRRFEEDYDVTPTEYRRRAFARER